MAGCAAIHPPARASATDRAIVDLEQGDYAKNSTS
jgi:hypothetical protein